jgi:hypothetical protein
MQATRSSETPILIRDGILHSSGRENLKSYVSYGTALLKLIILSQRLQRIIPGFSLS